MLISENFIRVVKINLKIQESVGSQSFTFDCNQNLVLRDKSRQNREYLKIWFCLFYTISYWTELFTYWKSSSLILALQALLFTISCTVFFLTKGMLYSRRENVIELFNLFIQFEKRQPNGNFCCFLLASEVF